MNTTVERPTFEPTIGGLVKPVTEIVRHLQPAAYLADVPIQSFHTTVKGLNEFIDRAEQIQADCRDITVLGQDMLPVFTNGALEVSIRGDRYRLSDWALQQWCTRLKIPREYAINMLKAEKHDLFLQNFESWLDTHAHEHIFLIRLHNGVIRGMLSEQYKPFDTLQVLQALQQGLEHTGLSCTVDKGIVTAEQINLRIVSSQKFAIQGDPHYMGIRLQSSDVGQHAVSLAFFVYRSRCANGMFFGKKEGTLFRKRHTASQIQSVRSMEQSLVRMVQELPDLISTVQQRLEWAQEKKMTDQDLERIIEQFQLRTSGGKRTTDSFFRDIDVDMQAYGGRNLFSLANVLTERAQRLDLARAEEIEQFAGELILSHRK